MKNELEMLTQSDKPVKDDCTYDSYIKVIGNHRCFVPHVDCNKCIFDGYMNGSNKRLQELIPIISLEDL